MGQGLGPMVAGVGDSALTKGLFEARGGPFMISPPDETGDAMIRDFLSVT